MHRNVYRRTIRVRIRIVDAFRFSQSSSVIHSAYNDIRGFMTNDYFQKALNAEVTDPVSPALHESTPNDLSVTLADLPTGSLVIFIDSGQSS